MALSFLCMIRNSFKIRENFFEKIFKIEVIDIFYNMVCQVSWRQCWLLATIWEVKIQAIWHAKHSQKRIDCERSLYMRSYTIKVHSL